MTDSLCLEVLVRKLFNAAYSVWVMHGWWAPWVIISRVSLYFYCLLFRRWKTFSYDGRTHRYAFHLANVTFRCERTVEIPIALKTYSLNGDVLEVGNVLTQYFLFHHDVVDKYEKEAGVINEDILTFAPGKLYDLILSVSTLEHVGWDEIPKKPEKLLPAFANLKSLLKPGGRLLATVPLGYNSFLDECLNRGLLELTRVSFMKRVSKTNDWVEASKEDAMNRTYGSRYPCGNAIAIMIFEKAMV